MFCYLKRGDTPLCRLRLSLNIALTALIAHIGVAFFSGCEPLPSPADSDELAGEIMAGAEPAGGEAAGEEEAGEVMAGEVMAGEVMAGEVMAGEVMAGEIMAGEVMAGEVMAGEIMAGDDTPDLEVAYVTLNQSSWLFTNSEETTQLTFQVYNRAGELLERPDGEWDAEWESGQEEVATVSADGLVTAGGVGSSQVYVDVEGVRSTPALIVNARLREEVRVFTMDDIDLESVTRVDDRADLLNVVIELTWRSSDPIEVGTVLIPSEELPIYGRVSSVSVDSDITRVQLTPIDLRDVFSELNLNESLDMNAASLIEVTTDNKNALGCEADIGDEVEVVFTPAFELTQLPQIIIQATPERFDFKAVGPLEAELGIAEFGLDLSVSASVTCERTFFALNIPLPGPLTLLLQLRAELGARLEAKLTLAGSFTASLLGTVSSQINAGVECDLTMMGGGCIPVEEVDLTIGEFRPEWVKRGERKVEGSIVLGAFLKGIARSPVVTAARFIDALFEGEDFEEDGADKIELVEAFVGASSAVEINPPAAQLLDPEAANYLNLEAVAEVQLKLPTEQLKPFINLELSDLNFAIDPITLLENPRGATLMMPERDFEVGDTLEFTFTVNNQDNSALFGDPEEVTYYQVRGERVDVIGSAPYGQPFQWVATEEAVNGSDEGPIKIGSTYSHPLDFGSQFETSLNSLITLSSEPVSCQYTPQLMRVTDEYFTEFTGDADINVRGEVSFSGRTSVGQRGDGVWWMSAPGESTLVSFPINENSSRSFRGSAIDDLDPPQILSADQRSPNYFFRTWSAGAPGEFNLLGRSGDDFGASTSWADLNNQGEVIHYAVSRVFEDEHCSNLQFYDQGGQRHTIQEVECGIRPSPQVRPQLSETGHFTYRDLTSELVVDHLTEARATVGDQCSEHSAMPGIDPSAQYVAAFSDCGSYGPHLFPLDGREPLALFEEAYPLEDVFMRGRVAVTTSASSCQGAAESDGGQITIALLSPARGDVPAGIDVIEVSSSEGALQVTRRLRVLSVGDLIESELFDEAISEIKPPHHLMSSNGHLVILVDFESGRSGIIRALRSSP